MSDTPNETKQKRGRKKGSSNTVNLSLETLNKYLKPDMNIPLQRKWVEQFEEFFNVSIIEEDEVGMPTEESAASAPEPIRERVDIEEEEL